MDGIVNGADDIIDKVPAAGRGRLADAANSRLATGRVSIDPYGGAVGHYSSSERDDYVKTAWERPQLLGILREVVGFLSEAIPGESRIRVLDLGAGAGEGFDLLDQAIADAAIYRGMDYHGLDKSRTMLELASNKMRNRRLTRGHTFRTSWGDMQKFEYDATPVDLYLSVGVPFSHLTHRQFCRVLTKIYHAILRRSLPTVLVLDVLGRYSLEWLPLAASRRRQYSMTFFAQSPSPPTTWMTFYSRSDLLSAINHTLPPELSDRLKTILFWDRSVLVGRHTGTQRYNPGMPPLRPSVNRLAAMGAPTAAALNDLRLDDESLLARSGNLPSEIRSAINVRCEKWNSVLDAAIRTLPGTHAICEALRLVDVGDAAGGIGIGHSLTAVLLFK